MTKSVEVFLLGLGESLAGFLQAIEIDVGGGEVSVADNRGFQALLGLGFDDRFVILAESGVDEPKIAVRDVVVGIAFCPEFVGFGGLFNFSGDVLEIERGDAVALALTDAVAQVVCLLGIFRSQAGAAKIRVLNRETNIRHGEVGVEFDSALHEGDSFGVTLGASGGDTHAVGFESFEGGSGGFDGHIELLHRGQRFAEFGAQAGSGFIQCLQHVGLAGGLDLFLGETVAIAAAYGVYPDHVLAAEI